MPSARTKLHRRLLAIHRKFRELRMIAKGLVSTDHPVQAQIIPMRQCNLSCTYCSEYDDFSDPVPLEEMYRRGGKLGGRRTTPNVIQGGGAPLPPPPGENILAPSFPRKMSGHVNCRQPLVTRGS